LTVVDFRRDVVRVRLERCLVHLRRPVFQISGFGIRVLGFRIRNPDSGFGIRDSILRFRVFGFGFRDWGLGIRVSGLEIRISGFGFRE
jgi:hypothetical protein